MYVRTYVCTVCSGFGKDENFCVHTCMFTYKSYIYIYITTEGERERERDIYIYRCTYIYTHANQATEDRIRQTSSCRTQHTSNTGAVQKPTTCTDRIVTDDLAIFMFFCSQLDMISQIENKSRSFLK